MVGMGAADGPGVGVAMPVGAPTTVGALTLVGEAAAIVGDATGVIDVPVGGGVISATEVAAGCCVSCVDNRPAASTVPTTTRPLTMPVSSCRQLLLARRLLLARLLLVGLSVRVSALRVFNVSLRLGFVHHSSMNLRWAAEK